MTKAEIISDLQYHVDHVHEWANPKITKGDHIVDVDRMTASVSTATLRALVLMEPFRSDEGCKPGEGWGQVRKQSLKTNLRVVQISIPWIKAILKQLGTADKAPKGSK